jgi:hypothetical protein
LVIFLAAAFLTTGCFDEADVDDGPDPNQPSNGAPSISGSPGITATVNTLYVFQPQARDPDGDSLRFSISGKPVWAIFDVQTGRLSGVPSPDTVGTSADIRISVSDGTHDAALAPFKLAVADRAVSGDRTATLSWSAPSTNADGSPLTDLAGYRIYYGTSPATMGMTAQVDAAARSVDIDGLSTGIWYFAMASVNVHGIESERTATVSASL